MSRGRHGQETFEVVDPGEGMPFAHVPDLSPVDAQQALERAVVAQREWAATSPSSRAEMLHEVRRLLLERREEVAVLITLEMGKPIEQARAEVDYAAGYLRWFAEEAVRISGRWGQPLRGDTRVIVERRPVGPTVVVTPWNFPLAMAARKVGPALAAGCVVLAKPAPETPLTLLALAALGRAAGLPDGVLTVLSTTRAADVVSTLLADPRVRKVSFTGSTGVGRALLHQAADPVLRVSMELGGNAPFVVLDDADVDRAAEAAITAKLRNAGQACTALNRCYVHSSLVHDVAEAIAARMSEVTVGHGLDPDVRMGPLVSAAAQQRVHHLVGEAVQAGARTVTGGYLLDRPGWFHSPTVLVEVPPATRVVHEEIFGPVLAIQSFANDAEALAAANGSEHGLAAYVISQDRWRAIEFARGVEAGLIGINTGAISDPAVPFGGVKASGVGREGGLEGIDEYLETVSLVVA